MNFCSVAAVWLSVHASALSPHPRISSRPRSLRVASLRALVTDLDEDTRRLNEASHRDSLAASEGSFFHLEKPAGSSRTPIDLEKPAGSGSRTPIEFDCYSFPGDGYRGTDANPPTPFGPDQMARVSRTALLTAAECASMVDEAESNGAWSGGGRSAHYAARAGSSFSITDLPGALRLLNERLLPALLPAIDDAFPAAFDAGASSLRLQEARLVKYNASAGQTELGMHRDGPVVTATVALNAPSDYGGGGTLVEPLGIFGREGGRGSAHEAADPAAAFRVERGRAVLHPGNVRHGGAEIHSGVRYILVCFIFDADAVDHDRLCLLRANALLARALKASKGSTYARELLAAAAAEFGNSLLCGNADKAESAHVGLGQALLEIGEARAAADALEAAVEAAPCNAHALSTLAAARAALGDRRGACDAARGACDADPRSPTARNNLGLLMLAAADDASSADAQAEAMGVFADGLALDPDDPELLLNTGVCVAELGDVSAAAQLFAAALEVRPSCARAKQNLAACLEALGQTQT